MGIITLMEITKCIVYILFFNIVFALILFPWVTNDDLNNIQEPPLNRFISLFYYGITTFTTTGYAKSNRMKLFVSLYMIFVFSITASFLFKI